MKKIFLFILLVANITAFSQSTFGLDDASVLPSAYSNPASIYTLRKTRPGVTSYLVKIQGFYTAGDGGDGLWYWNPSSTAVDDTMSVLTPTGYSGSGRWIKVVSPNGIYLKELGVLPATGTADNSYRFNKAIGLFPGIPIIINKNSTFIGNPDLYSDGIAFRLNSNTILKGEDPESSILKMKAGYTYAGSGASLLGYADYTFTTAIRHVKLTDFTLDGNQKFANDTFATGTPVTDSGQNLLSIYTADSIYTKGLRYRNGGAGHAVTTFKLTNFTDEFSSFDSIGNICYYNPYDTNCRFWKLTDGYANHFGLLHKYDGDPHGLAHKRNGNDFFLGGGDHIYIKRWTIKNGADNIWFMMEGAFNGYFELTDINWYGNHRPAGGFSVGDNYFLTPTKYVPCLIEHNTDYDVDYTVYKAKDSIIEGGVKMLLYTQPKYNEWGGMGGDSTGSAIIRNNRWMNTIFSLYRKNKNVTITGDFVDNGQMNTTLYSGSGYVYQISNFYDGDTTTNITIKNSKFIIGSGTLLVVGNNGNNTQGITFENNDVVSIKDFTLADIYPDNNGIAPLNVNFIRNRFKGPVSYTFLYGKASSNALNIGMRENDFTMTTNSTNTFNTPIDTTTRMLVNLGGTVNVDLTGSNFAWGRYSLLFDSIRNNSGVLEGRRNGLWKPQATPQNISNTNLVQAANRTYSGNSTSLQFGTTGSPFSSYQVNSAADITLNAGTNVAIAGALSIPNAAQVASGTSFTVANTYSNVEFTFSSVQSAFTLTLPASPSNGMEVFINMLGTGTNGTPEITSFTVSPNSGQTIKGAAVTTANYGDFFWYHYSQTSATWIRRH